VSDVGSRIDAVEVGGRRIRYAETGRGPVLVHFAGGRGSALTPAHGLLARRFRVLAFEAPAPDGDASEALVTGLAAAMQRLGVESFDLIGSSASAAMAVALAARAHDRVRALVLESPPALDATRPDPALARGLGQLATPTLVLFGTEDTTVPADTGRRYKALVPGSHLVFVYAASHAIAADRPEAFVEVVSDFLERHEAFVVSRTRTVILP
jgi:pimeloyl-ACP methyl ester carboxylesterase